MYFELSTEEFFKRRGYSLNTSVSEAMEIKRRHPEASNAEIAKMNILSKRQRYAEEGNWGMYGVTVNNLQNVYGMIGDREQELECLLQSFYLMVEEGREYTPYFIEQIHDAMNALGVGVEELPAFLKRSVGMLPTSMIGKDPEIYCNQLISDVKGFSPAPFNPFDPFGYGPARVLASVDEAADLDGYYLIDCIKETEEAGGEVSLILSLLEIAEHKRISPNTKAGVCKRRGELLQQTGQNGDALEAYKKALSYNPKVGVKRRIAALEKMEVSQ